MNILYIADPASIHDIKWMRFFTQEHQCFFIVREHHDRETPPEKYQELEERYNLKFVGAIHDFSIRKYSQTRATSRQIQSLIQKHNIDLFHILYAEPNALWGIFKKQYNLPMVLTTRGTDVLKTIPSFFGKWHPIKWLSAHWYKKAFRNMDYIVGTSTRQMKSVQTLSNRTERLAVIRTGVDVDKIQKDTSAFQLEVLEGRKYVFFPRAMRPIYQQELAVKAIGLLPQAITENYSFVFVDKKSRDKAYVSQVQIEMDKYSNVDFLWLEHLDQMTLFETYKNASLVVMTPMSDGTPVTAIEAMLCKIPLLLPPLEYDKDLFGKGVAYFEDWKATSLASKMQEILSEKQFLDVDLAYKNASNLADRKKEMTRLGEIYQSLLATED